ncbi:DUF294 nucleotidyltransferase-like domain-containing protein [Marinicrinis sediminis]|uniref:DUF294 nucleotidyltransferase-like domain-containing protein n=1 Tax=Marinicrinis sediminis TaxID=1652465 RepID=A0ABW5RA24_9BACL
MCTRERREGWERWLQQVQNSTDLQQLSRIRKQFHEDLSGEQRAVETLVEVEWINRIYDAMIEQTVKLSYGQLNEQGKGWPPVPFQFVLYGSGGRQELTLWSDQDNGIVYETPPNGQEEEVQAYFLQLGEAVVAGLHEIGFPPCDGKVVSSEPMWCTTYAQWADRMDAWIADPNWEHIRYLLICLDARPLFTYGKVSFQLQLPLDAYRHYDVTVLPHLVANTLKHKMVLNIFGGLIPEPYGEDAGTIDIKYGCYIPIVNAIRLLAVAEGIAESSTRQRFWKLRTSGTYPVVELKKWEEAWIYFLELRNQVHAQYEQGVFAASGKLRVERMTKEMKHTLKSHVRTGNALQKMIRRKIGSGG